MDMVGSSLELSFPGFRMAIFWVCLHKVGIVFFMKHLLSIDSRYRWYRYYLVAPPKHHLFQRFGVFCNTTTFLYSSSLKGYTMDVSHSVAGGSTARSDVDDMLIIIIYI